MKLFDIKFMIIGFTLTIYFSCTVKNRALRKKAIDKRESQRTPVEKTSGHKSFVLPTDSIKISEYLVLRRDYFTFYKDSIIIEEMIFPRKFNKGKSFPFKPNTYRIDIGKSTDAEGLLVQYSFMAQSGDSEIEAWLLDFFDRYIDEAIAWNNKYSDGPDGLPELYYKPMRGMLQVINRLAPSKEKIRLYQKLAGQETGPCHTYSEDVGCTYGDNLVFNGVSTNIADKTYRRSLLDEKWEIPDNWEKWTTEKLPTLIEDILNDKIVMIDRETWKRR